MIAMKKLFTLLSLAALITVAVAGCESNDDPIRPETIDLSQSEILFYGDIPGFQEISVDGKNWEIASFSVESADSDTEIVYDEFEGIGRTIAELKNSWFRIIRSKSDIKVEVAPWWSGEKDKTRRVTLLLSAPGNAEAAELTVTQTSEFSPVKDIIGLSSKELVFDATGGEQTVTTESESWSMIGLYIGSLHYSFDYIGDYEGLLTAEYDPGIGNGQAPVRVRGEWFDIGREKRSITVKLAPNEGPAREMNLCLNLGDYNDYLRIEQAGRE